MLNTPMRVSCVAILALSASHAAQGLDPFDPTLLDVSTASVQLLELPADAPPWFRVEVELEGEVVALSFNRYSMRAADFRVLVQDEDGGYRDVPPAPVVTYRGGIAGSPGGVVAGALLEDGLHALVRRGEQLFAIQPAPGLAGRHAVYDAAHTLARDVTCGAPHDATPRPAAPTKSASGGADQVAQVGIDTDNQFYLDQGGSVVASQLEVESIMNGVEAIYDVDHDVLFELTAIVVRTFEPDPYTGNIFSRLDQSLAVWTTDLAAIPRDVVHLFTGLGVSSGVIGVAYLDALCEFDFGNAVSDVEFTSSFTTKVGLVSHEFGHNFGSGHCDGSSDCKIMCSFIGGCAGDVTTFGSQAKGEIAGYLAGVSCLAPPGGCGAVSYGLSEGNTTSLSATGPITPGSSLTLVYANPLTAPSTAFAVIAGNQGSSPLGPGTLLLAGPLLLFTPGVSFSSTFVARTEAITIPNIAGLVGAVFFIQAAHEVGATFTELSNGVRVQICP